MRGYRLYSSMQISGYRGLDSFKIDGLGRINLLVGTNNSGKTSILECVELLRSAGNAYVLTNILGRRGEWAFSSEEERRGYLDISHMFANHELFGKVVIEGDCIDTADPSIWNNRVTVAVTNLYRHQLELEEGTPLGEDRQTVLRVKWSRETDSLETRLTSDGFLPWSWKPRASSMRDGSNQPVQFIRTNGMTAADVVRLFDEVVLTEREDHVTQALRIIDRSIERIASLGVERGPFLREAPSGVVLKMQGIPYRVPIGSVGDGMWRMLGLALAISNANGGVLLVDEIDTGLHYSVMEDMWRMISNQAAALDVQVFATTHSRDCYESLAAIVDAGLESAGITIQRIDARRGRAVRFSDDDIIAAAERGIEVR